MQSDLFLREFDLNSRSTHCFFQSLFLVSAIKSAIEIDFLSAPTDSCWTDVHWLGKQSNHIFFLVEMILFDMSCNYMPLMNMFMFHANSTLMSHSQEMLHC